MDQFTINRLGNIRHEEIVAWSEQQPNVVTRQWKLPDVFAPIRRIFAQEQAAPLKPTTNANDC